eukprot:CAMPEP_0172776140 /NCGR_PEP_ID=MMETSP1074-20121228/199301_1 /TAXON_ID=2916 /ORGANISM="Ceratium fusus, Strain PA161109" /LENGTH=89 /DNA_ID=CAMNT_0013612875 /DNA_START=355 /DNA_END=620 /DNA_ORIENTATION=-
MGVPLNLPTPHHKMFKAQHEAENADQRKEGQVVLSKPTFRACPTLTCQVYLEYCTSHQKHQHAARTPAWRTPNLALMQHVVKHPILKHG